MSGYTCCLDDPGQWFSKAGTRDWGGERLRPELRQAFRLGPRRAPRESGSEESVYHELAQQNHAKNGHYDQDGVSAQIQGCHPAASLRDPPGNVVAKYDVSQKAGHLAQEAGQTTLVDIQGQAVAEAQESHHTAPADAALKQAVSVAAGLEAILVKSS